MRERAQHRCRVNFSLLRRCDGSILARLTPTQNQLFTFASVRQLNSRSLNTDTESTFHFCIGSTAQFSLAQHRCRINFSLLRRFDCSVFARSAPMQSQLFAFASVRQLNSRSFNTDAVSTFCICIGTRDSEPSPTPTQPQTTSNLLHTSSVPEDKKPLHTLSTKHEEQGESLQIKSQVPNRT